VCEEERGGRYGDYEEGEVGVAFLITGRGDKGRVEDVRKG
jgi:hypothetical protein